MNKTDKLLLALLILITWTILIMANYSMLTSTEGIPFNIFYTLVLLDIVAAAISTMLIKLALLNLIKSHSTKDPLI